MTSTASRNFASTFERAPTRRAVLDVAVRGALGAGLAVSGLCPRVGAQSARSTDAVDPGGVLVALQLTGGNDGLSTLVPYADDAYHAARPTIARKGNQVIQLNESRGLHSGLVRLRERYDAGQVALIEGVGYERPNRSHFKSLEVWHAGDRDGKSVSEGWLGRLAGAMGGAADPLRVVHVGKRVPFSVYSRKRPALALQVPEVYRWVEHGAVLSEASHDASESDARAEVLEMLRRTARDAKASSEAIRAAVARHETKQSYPDDEFGRSLRVAAALVHADEGTRILSLELRGFDHHNNLRNRHDRLMGRLDEGLEAFLNDLASSERGRRTAVLCFSEFGRRVAENGSAGTDHGKAGIAFVLGSQVLGGLHGAPPSLTELSKGDLVHTTDFRSVYGALSEGLFGVLAGTLLAPEVQPLKLVDLSV